MKTSDVLGLAALGGVLLLGKNFLDTIVPKDKETVTGNVVTDIPYNLGYSIGYMYPVGSLLGYLFNQPTARDNLSYEYAQTIDSTGKTQWAAAEKASATKAIEDQILEYELAREYQLALIDRDYAMGDTSQEGIRMARVKEYDQQIYALQAKLEQQQTVAVTQPVYNPITTKTEEPAFKLPSDFFVQTDKVLEAKQNTVLTQMQTYVDGAFGEATFSFTNNGNGTFTMRASSNAVSVQRGGSDTKIFKAPVVVSTNYAGYVSPRSEISGGESFRVYNDGGIEVSHMGVVK